LLLARKHSIVSVELQNGILPRATVPDFPVDYIADSHIFWGEFDRDKELACGKDHPRFMLGGNGRFDCYFRYLKKASDVYIKKQPGRIGITSPWIYKFISPHVTVETICGKYYRFICDVARKMPEVNFSFKIKSGWSHYHMVTNLIAEYEIKNFEVVETVSFEEWFSSLSALITPGSTMGIEAMIFDVPVIILSPQKWVDPVGYEASDAVDVVHSAEELQHALSANMQNPGRKARERTQFVRYALEDTEGAAAIRTVQIISQLLHECEATRNQHSKHV